MIDTTQNLSIAAAHAYLNRKALKRAERGERLLLGIILGCVLFMGVIVGILLAKGGWL